MGEQVPRRVGELSAAEPESFVEVHPDTVFLPFHFADGQAANLITNPALDPVSRMPEFKACAVRLEPDPSEGAA